MSSRSGNKRKRASNNNKTASTRRSSTSATAPVPPPPAALIDLLRSDSTVLEYFQSLQSSLEADVKQWKDRATRYRDQAKQLQVQLNNVETQDSDNNKIDEKSTPRKRTTAKKQSESRTNQKRKNKTTKVALAEATRKGKQQGRDDSSSEEVEDEITPVASKKEYKDQQQPESESERKENNQEKEQETFPIDDSIFDCLSSDDEDDDNSDSSIGGKKDGGDYTQKIEVTSKIQSAAQNRALLEIRQIQDMKDRVRHIVEGYEALQLLGVQVVRVIEDPDPEINKDQVADTAMIKNSNCNDTLFSEDQEGSSSSSSEDEYSFFPKDQPKQDANTSLPPKKKEIQRRSNHDVIADIMNALRTLTRLQFRLKSGKLAYPPFIRFTGSNSAFPCCYPVTQQYSMSNTDLSHHPAVEGCTAVFQAISVMDLYCDDDISDSVWDRGFASSIESENNIKEEIRIGMRNRTGMVKMVIDSLRGEITDIWAVADRSSRLITTALHFQPMPSPSSEDDISLESKENRTEKDFGTKSQSRLSSLAERCMHAQLISRFYCQRSDPLEVAKLVWNYILSATPSLTCENYPRLPPALSLCIVEALLQQNQTCPRGKGDGSKREPSWFAYILQQCCTSTNQNQLLLLKALSVALKSTTCIWNDRLASDDDRITDISKVELSSYDRLKQSEAVWFQTGDAFETIDACKKEALEIVEESYAQICSPYTFNTSEFDFDKKVFSADNNSSNFGNDGEFVDAALAFELALVILGDLELVKKKFRQTVVYLKRSESESYSRERGARYITSALIACCSALRQIKIRNIDAFRLRHGALEQNLSSLDLLPVDKEWAALQLKKTEQLNSNLLISLGKCCVHLADGESMYRILELVTSTSKVIDPADEKYRNEMLRALVELADNGFIPTVRVINLERRQDRMNTFMAQAQQERILVVKALAHLDHSDKPVSETVSLDSNLFWGCYAFDGKEGAAEVQENLATKVGGVLKLNTMVDTHWRPNDLKAFDKDARDDDELVRTSPSERACALSHIASWKGVITSAFDISGATASLRYIYRDPSKLLGLFRSCGFAQGLPLLQENDHMPPSPAFVVLEDDAILVDRFSDRLKSILEELPRDFHFCSIGYSRPKTAPIVKYSSNVGIPSCIWYLTGYIISAEGAKYLMKSLPVKGPVDSWIGLKMCANWDNIWGYKLGVGVHSRPSADTPRRKDLATIMKFRAFCALVPLCSQKVDVSAVGTTGRSWRQRDTDITYSGNS